MVKISAIFFFLCSLVLLFSALPVSAQEERSYSFEIFCGEQFNIPTPLVMKQRGKEDIRINGARYKSEAWTGFNSPYYAWRFGLWEGGRAWEIELVHEKIILGNRPDEVQHFEISHGYNLLTLNRAWRLSQLKEMIFRVGGGIVITHPESTIRNMEKGSGGSFPNGFYISGPTAQVAIGKRFGIWRGLFGVLELKLTASYARVPVADGHADVPNAAVHGLIGIGYDYAPKK